MAGDRHGMRSMPRDDSN